MNSKNKKKNGNKLRVARGPTADEVSPLEATDQLSADLHFLFGRHREGFAQRRFHVAEDGVRRRLGGDEVRVRR